MIKLTIKRLTPFLILAIVSVIAIFIKADSVFDGSKIYSGSDIAWIIVATALVFLMTPGLAFFYGGMVNRKNVLSTMIKSFVAAGIVSIIWLVFGFSMSFGPSIHGIIGNPLHFAFFRGVFSSMPWPGGPTIPMPLFALFQLMFAIITPALVVTYSFVVSFMIFKFINFILPLRVSLEEEEMGLDASQHDENYVQGTLLVKNSN
jgi:ammonium transporter, Amt family